jgi:hypothetical protein
LHRVDNVLPQRLHLAIDVIEARIHIDTQLVAVRLVLHVLGIEAFPHLGIAVGAFGFQL